MEFNRVVGRNLKEEFFRVLDGLCPSLMEIFEKKTGWIGKELADLLQTTDNGGLIFLVMILMVSSYLLQILILPHFLVVLLYMKK